MLVDEKIYENMYNIVKNCCLSCDNKHLSCLGNT